MSVTPLHPPQTTRSRFAATLITSSRRLAISILIDSRAEGNFIAASLATELHLTPSHLGAPLEAKALTGVQLAAITQVTPPVSLLISGNHQKTIVFYIIDSPDVSVVLGHPWLVKHNPHIDWANGNILGWSAGCLSHCLRNALMPQCPVRPSTEEPLKLPGVPPVYLDLRAVFSKAKATSLPPHRPYDMAIELLPGAFPPRGRLYSLSLPETEYSMLV